MLFPVYIGIDRFAGFAIHLCIFLLDLMLSRRYFIIFPSHHLIIIIFWCYIHFILIIDQLGIRIRIISVELSIQVLPPGHPATLGG